MLDKDAIKNGIHAYGTFAAAANAWTFAVGNLFSGVVPASTTVFASQPALSSALNAAFQQPDPASVISAMEAAFAAYATAVGLGMAGFVATPPAGPVGFATLFAPPHPSTREDANQQLADLIHSWATTGTATPLPSGSPVSWS